MKYIVKINNKEYEVEVEKGKANLLKTVEAAAVPVQMPSARTACVAVPVQADEYISEGEQILAPMPGTVLEIKVCDGAFVKKGDVLLILEAMKMENEIAAPRDCRIMQIAAQKGTVVETDDLLMIIQ